MAKYIAGAQVEPHMLKLFKSKAIALTIKGARKVAEEGRKHGFPGSNIEGSYGVSQWGYECAIWGMFHVVKDYEDNPSGYFVDLLGAPKPPMHEAGATRGGKRLKCGNGEFYHTKQKADSDDQPTPQVRSSRKRKRQVVDSDDEAEESQPTIPSKRSRADEDELPENSGDELFVSRSIDDIDQLPTAPFDDSRFDSEEIQEAILNSSKPNDENKFHGSVSGLGNPRKKQKTQHSRRFNGPFYEDSDDEDGVGAGTGAVAHGSKVDKSAQPSSATLSLTRSKVPLQQPTASKKGTRAAVGGDTQPITRGNATPSTRAATASAAFSRLTRSQTLKTSSQQGSSNSSAQVASGSSSTPVTQPNATHTVPSAIVNQAPSAPAIQPTATHIPPGVVVNQAPTAPMFISLGPSEYETLKKSAAESTTAKIALHLNGAATSDDILKKIKDIKSKAMDDRTELRETNPRWISWSNATRSSRSTTASGRRAGSKPTRA